MSTSTLSPMDDKDQFESLMTTFASLRSEVERRSTELQTLESQFRQELQQYLADAAHTLEDQLKHEVTAAEQAARQQTLIELRAKYTKELELALTEKALIDRRPQTTTKQFEE